MAEQDLTAEELRTEQWRPVVGYEGLYSVSSLGRVRGEPKYDRLGRYVRPGIRYQSRTSSRYLAVLLYRDGKVRAPKVHHLVLAAFVGPRGALQVNHRDGVRENNRLNNLEYVTARENALHAYRELGHPRTDNKGEKNGRAKLGAADVVEIRRLHAGGETYANIARRYRMTLQAIRDIVLRVRWPHIP